MAKKRPYNRKLHPDGTPLSESEKYALHREDMRQRMAEKVEAANEIKPLPAVVNPDLKEACRFNLQLFSESYVRGLFKGVSKRWSGFHLLAFKILQDAILNGGLFALALPRGSGKSALIKAAIIWAAVYGHCHFAVVVCASNPLAIQFLRSIKKQLRGSKRLFEDFPEVCYPIRLIENKASKCNGQKLDGVRTAMEWGYAHIVLPTIPGYKSSGFKIVTSGITGSGLRGLVDAKEDGDEERVDFVAVDDFQTRGSARSVKQTTTRLDILRGDILGMAGPGEKMAVAAAVTVIEPNDGADQLLEDPNWQGMRHGLLTKLPDNMELWRQYREIQQDSKNRRLGVGPENLFYDLHRQEMDTGCQATWEDRFNPVTEISAIQSAMNLYFLVKPKAFWAEYMNQPESLNAGDLYKLDPKEICKRLNGVDRFKVPFGYETITVGCDVQLHVLFYWVTAWKDDFTGAVIDYGIIPDQGRRYIASLDDLARTLQSESRAAEADVDAAVSWGLQQLGEKVLDRGYIREDGVTLKAKRCHIDINWQPSESAVARFCRISKWASICTPARGQAISNTRRRVSAWAERPGERHPPKAIKRQCEWMITSPRGHLVRECYHLKSFWQSRLNTAFSLPLHSPGSISLYGTSPEEHTMLSEHLTAHYPMDKKVGNDEYVEWILRVGGGRYDLLDSAINSAVAASVEGVQLGVETAVTSVSARRTFKLPGRVA